MNVAEIKNTLARETRNHMLIERFFRLFYVRNRNIKSSIEKERVYQLMEKKYANIINGEIKKEAAAEPSDYVWICWLQGEERAPDLVRACINSIRRNLTGRKIVILSKKNIPEYIQFPDYIQKKWENGIISPAHYSDLLRTELLCKYGGMWIDATVLCTTDKIPNAITSAPLFVFQDIDLSRLDRNAIISSSWFISSWSNQKILLLTRELLHQYWKTEKMLNQYFLFHIFFAISCRKYQEDWENVPVFSNQPPHVLQFELAEKYHPERWKDITAMSCVHKLNHHNDYSVFKDSFYQHILKEYKTD